MADPPRVSSSPRMGTRRRFEPRYLIKGSACPAEKDKLFYFGNYEGQRYSVGSTYTTTAPVTVAGGGPGVSLVDACNAVGAANISPLSAHIAGVHPETCHSAHELYPRQQ